MSASGITPEQLQEANLIDETLHKLTSLKEELTNFKLGDVFIIEEWDKYNKIVEKNRFGFPNKYKVVYISKEGIPFLRQLSSSGRPTGPVILPHVIMFVRQILDLNTLNNASDEGWHFAPDPEQLDAILLQQEFDPTEQYKLKTALLNEIRKHNEKVRVATRYNYPKISEFFKSLKSGDKFWTSAENQFVFQSLTKRMGEWDITAVDINQQTCHFNFKYFLNRRLYRAAPRSFTKESAT